MAEESATVSIYGVETKFWKDADGRWNYRRGASSVLHSIPTSSNSEDRKASQRIELLLDGLSTGVLLLRQVSSVNRALAEWQKTSRNVLPKTDDDTEFPLTWMFARRPDTYALNIYRGSPSKILNISSKISDEVLLEVIRWATPPTQDELSTWELLDASLRYGDVARGRETDFIVWKRRSGTLSLSCAAEMSQRVEDWTSPIGVAVTESVLKVCLLLGRGGLSVMARKIAEMKLPPSFFDNLLRLSATSELNPDKNPLAEAALQFFWIFNSGNITPENMTLPDREHSNMPTLVAVLSKCENALARAVEQQKAVCAMKTHDFVSNRNRVEIHLKRVHNLLATWGRLVILFAHPHSVRSALAERAQVHLHSSYRLWILDQTRLFGTECSQSLFLGREIVREWEECYLSVECQQLAS